MRVSAVAWRLSAVMVVALFGSADPSATSCLAEKIRKLRQNDEIGPIFRGAVIRKETKPLESTIEFSVHRVWKGQIAQRFVIHTSPGSGFDVGSEWFVVAYRMAPAARQAHGIRANAPASYAFDCLTRPVDDQLVGWILEGDRGYEPDY